MSVRPDYFTCNARPELLALTVSHPGGGFVASDWPADRGCSGQFLVKGGDGRGMGGHGAKGDRGGHGGEEEENGGMGEQMETTGVSQLDTEPRLEGGGELSTRRKKREC